MRKLIVLPGANQEHCEMMAKHIHDMKEDDSIITTHDIKIYNIDDAEIFTPEHVKKFCEEMGIKIE